MTNLSRRWIDYWILTSSLLLVAHSFNVSDDVTFASYGEAAGTGSLGKQLGFAVLFVYALLGFVAQRNKAFRLRTWSASLSAAFFTLVTFSIGWSTAPHTSLVRWTGFATFVFAGMVAATRLEETDTIPWYVVSLSTYITLGFLFELMHGTFHPLSAGYRFGGINTANATGSEAVLLAFASIAALKFLPTSRSRLYVFIFAAAVAVLLLTRSRTALVCLVSSLTIVYSIVYLRGIRLAMFVYGGALLLSAPFVLSAARLIDVSHTLSLGRSDASGDVLTGRVPLWTQLYEDYISSRPILGFGYGAFWTPGRIEKISYDQQWNIAAAHSTYLDAILALGVPGGILYITVMMSLLSRALRLARRGKAEGFFFACLLIAALIDGATESETWYLSSVYLFATVQCVFSLNLIESRPQSRLFSPSVLSQVGSRPQMTKRDTDCTI